MTQGDTDSPSPEPVAEAAADAAPERGPRQARAGAFLGVPIEVTISVGKARPLVSELVELRRDSVLTLDSSIDDPVELYIGDRLIARGELQEIGDDSGRLGVRLTEVADFSNEIDTRLVGAAVLAALAAGVLLAQPALAQDISINFGEGQSLGLRTVQLFILLTLLSLAPGLAMMVTCFPFMVTVLSILRQAIGVQQAPPNMMIVSLALFLTWFVMEPVFTEAWRSGVQPMIEGTLQPEQAFAPTIAPFRRFMDGRVDAGTIAALTDAAPRALPGPADAPGATPLSILVPAFLLSEIKRGFEVGFLIFLPFLVIDLVIAAILMSMGMMMVPPAVVSLPFKLAFFVIADGWTLLAGAMVRSYAP